MTISYSPGSGGSGGSAILVQNTAQLNASTLIKTGPGRPISLLITANTGGRITLRNGTNGSGAVVTGWGGSPVSSAGLSVGVELTLNVPYTPSGAPLDFANGIYAEITGSLTYMVVYI